MSISDKLCCVWKHVTWNWTSIPHSRMWRYLHRSEWYDPQSWFPRIQLPWEFQLWVVPGGTHRALPHPQLWELQPAEHCRMHCWLCGGQRVQCLRWENKRTTHTYTTLHTVSVNMHFLYAVSSVNKLHNHQLCTEIRSDSIWNPKSCHYQWNKPLFEKSKPEVFNRGSAEVLQGKFLVD